MEGRTLSILLGSGAGLLAALLVLVTGLLLRRWLRRRRRPLAEKEVRRLSVRTVKRHPLHPTIGVPVQPAAGGGGDFAREQFERRHAQLRQQEFLRAAISKSMEHIVTEPGGRPSYAPPTPARDAESGGSVSPSEQSSVASDEEVQGSRAEKVRPRMEFHVVYTGVNSSLTVCINRLVNLPLRYRGRPFLVRLTVLGQQAESQPVLDAAAQQAQVLTFAGVAADWLDQGQLTCHLYVKRYKSLTEKLVGEGSVRLAELHLASCAPAACNVFFGKPGKKRTIPLQPAVTSPGDEAGILQPALGQLLLSLRYYPALNRMTVFLRRGENLPDSRSLVSPEFYVIVMLLKAGDIVTDQESRRVSGRAPVWNQSFNFDIPRPELEIHWIQCILMVSKIYTRDRRVGFCQLGPDTTESGARHWEESMKQRKDDMPRWHPLLPAPE